MRFVRSGLKQQPRRFGVCKYKGKSIGMSSHFLNSPTTTIQLVKNTLLHEIAHALVGGQHHHDKVWMKMALSIGCDGCRCGKGKLAVVAAFEIACTSCSGIRES